MLRKHQISSREFDQMRRSTCANCPCGCGVKVFLKNEVIVDIFGDDEHPANKGSFCPKGLLAYRHQANSERLTRPLIRRNKGSALEPASWDKAIEFTAERLKVLSESHGRDACYVHCTPSSSFGHLLGGTLFAREFGTAHGPWRFLPEPFGPGGALAETFGLAGSRMITNSPRDWCNSSCIVVYGCDPAVTDPMMMGPIVDARDRGQTVVVIDSQTTVTATKANYALRAKPGTQSVVLRGLLWLLFENGWIDEGFVTEATNGVEGLRAELAPFTPGRVAQTCGISEGELRRIAEIIGTAAPIQVISGGWFGQEQLTDEELGLCGALVALRGSIGIPGGGLSLLNASPFLSADWLGSDDSSADQASSLSIEGIVSDGARKVGAILLEGDPCARLSGGSSTLRGFGEIPLIVALSAYQNSSTHYADVVLPMASWLESDGLLASGNGRALQWHNRVMNPPQECRTQLEFWTQLAIKCGFGDRFPWHGAPSRSWNRVAADWALSNNFLTQAITVDLLDPEHNPPGGILWPCTDPADIEFERSRFSRGDVRGRNILFQRHQAFPKTKERFPTKDGRITFSVVHDTNEHTERGNRNLLLVPSVAVDHVESYSGVLTDRPNASASVKLILHPRTASDHKLAEGDWAIVTNGTDSLRGTVFVSDTAAEDTVWCLALPGSASKADGNRVTSPWSLLSIPRAGSPKPAYAVVTIHQDRS